MAAWALAQTEALLAAGAHGAPGAPDAPPQNTYSLVGCLFAIGGNVLISIALNLQKLVHNRIQDAAGAEPDSARDVDGPRAPSPTDPLLPSQDPGGSGRSSRSSGRSGDSDSPDNHTLYLQSPLWWLGFFFMALGELGNFTAYGFSPAILIAPLGTVALVCNAVLAPIFLKERIHTSHILGVTLSIIGTVGIIVVSSTTDEPTLAPPEIWKRMTQVSFLVYVLVTVILLVALKGAVSEWGKKIIVVDLGLGALYGGYTVLSTKILSSLLHPPSSIWQVLSTPLCYGLILVLLTTSIAQIHHLNRALANFPSVQVIPTQFVLFTLSAIVGSEVLFADFEVLEGGKSVLAISSLVFMCTGVWIISRRSGHSLSSAALDGPPESLSSGDTSPGAASRLSIPGGRIQSDQWLKDAEDLMDGPPEPLPPSLGPALSHRHHYTPFPQPVSSQVSPNAAPVLPLPGAADPVPPPILHSSSRPPPQSAIHFAPHPPSGSQPPAASSLDPAGTPPSPPSPLTPTSAGLLSEALGLRMTGIHGFGKSLSMVLDSIGSRGTRRAEFESVWSQYDHHGDRHSHSHSNSHSHSHSHAHARGSVPAKPVSQASLSSLASSASSGAPAAHRHTIHGFAPSDIRAGHDAPSRAPGDAASAASGDAASATLVNGLAPESGRRGVVMGSESAQTAEPVPDKPNPPESGRGETVLVSTSSQTPKPVLGNSHF